jgi:hypothetical protein
LLEDREAVVKDANALIAGALEKGKSAIRMISELSESDGDYETEIKQFVKEALAHLTLVNDVSTVTGVQYYIPFDYEYADDDIMSSTIDNIDLKDKNVDILSSLLYDMERDSKIWNSSYC